MNKRIRELAIDAAETSTWKPGLSNEDVAAYMQKFAEMIVKECITVLDKRDPDFNAFSKKVVKDHFGVE